MSKHATHRMNPKSLANLMPPPKAGEVRNPLGITRRPIAMAYDRDLSQKLNSAERKRIQREFKGIYLRPGVTWREVWVQRVRMRGVAEGDIVPLEVMADRTEGKAVQPIAIGMTIPGMVAETLTQLDAAALPEPYLEE